MITVDQAVRILEILESGEDPVRRVGEVNDTTPSEIDVCEELLTRADSIRVNYTVAGNRKKTGTLLTMILDRIREADK